MTAQSTPWKKICSLLLLLPVLASCAPAAVKANAEAFDMATKEYNRMLRWKELESACSIFFLSGQKDACVERAIKDRDVSIAEIRMKKREVQLLEGKGTVRLEIDYYIMPSNVVKSVEYLQNWEFFGKETDVEKGWRVKNLPPEYK